MASETFMSTPNPALLERHGLTVDEYQHIVRSLGREPTLTELGIFSVMWSEHCSYKSSRIHLKKLPTRGPRVVQGPGENAGAVDIGDGYAAVFKIESHNHPSFIEPYQGAATGVGGIIRDIFTMGARPIALLNSLRFGPMDGPDGARTRRIVEGVVAGIAGYGNSIGIPTIGGEIAFEPTYAGNPLVNVLCLGIARSDALVKGKAGGVGNPVYYVGASTGRDGIHGATMASAEFDEKSSEKRPAVQVGDPFMEKLLLEACLELMKTDALVGVQDMGAAGLTCSTCEMGARGGMGVEIDVSLVPQRETGMTPYEIMLSESQERMLLVVKRGREAEVEAIFEKWDLHAANIGIVTGDGLMRVKDRGAVVAEIPNTALVDEAPIYDRPTTRPGYLEDVQSLDLGSLPPAPTAVKALLALLSSPTVASKRWVYRQYDHMVRTNTLVLAGMGAGVVRVKGTPRALAISVDGNGRYGYLEPAARGHACCRRGGQERGVRGRCADRRDQLPELRQSSASRDHVAAGRIDRRDCGGVPRARRADYGRQRQSLQRDGRKGHLPDADDRRGRADRGCGTRARAGVQEIRRHDRPARRELRRARRERILEDRPWPGARSASGARSAARTRIDCVPDDGGSAGSPRVGARLLGWRPGRRRSPNARSTRRASASTWMCRAPPELTKGTR